VKAAARYIKFAAIDSDIAPKRSLQWICWEL